MAAGPLVPTHCRCCGSCRLESSPELRARRTGWGWRTCFAELHPRTWAARSATRSASPTCCRWTPRGQCHLGRPFSNISCVLAGGCLGLALVVKLTSATCVAGIVLGLFVALALGYHGHPRWTAIRATGLTAGATMAVFLIVYLPTTGLLLWRRYGDPLFPYYNGVFHSRVLLPGTGETPAGQSTHYSSPSRAQPAPWRDERG